MGMKDKQGEGRTQSKGCFVTKLKVEESRGAVSSDVDCFRHQ